MKKVVWLFGLFGVAAFATQPAQARRPAPRLVAAVAPQQATAPQVFALGGQASEAPRGYLGIGVAEITSESAKELKLPEVRGVEITRVEEDSPAAKAGLKPDDVVLEYNGQRVEGTEQLTRMVRETPPGRQVQLVISRNGSRQSLTVTTGQARSLPVIVGGIPAPGAAGAPPNRDMQRQFDEMQQRMREFRMPDLPEPFMSWRSSTLGIEGEPLTSQLADFFGVSKGVLVRSVTKGSPADKAGIKAGDVIVKVNGVEVSSPAQISARIRLLGARQTFPVTLVRNRQDTTLSVTLDDGNSGPARRIKSSRLRVRPLRLARPAWV
jgi:serine protease Do